MNKYRCYQRFASSFIPTTQIFHDINWLDNEFLTRFDTKLVCRLPKRQWWFFFIRPSYPPTGAPPRASLCGGLPSSLNGSVPANIYTLWCRPWQGISYRQVFGTLLSRFLLDVEFLLLNYQYCNPERDLNPGLWVSVYLNLTQALNRSATKAG